ncbi:MAG: hypothetical protein GY943_01780 [Chloroflexi bacterium]|nr:hypothetical protein [Chloroflexota bacterium]
MTLTNLFRLHAILAVIYAIGLVLIPKSIIGLLSDAPLGTVGTDVTRLFGAALVMISLIAWAASRMNGAEGRRAIALSLFVYTTLGTIITLLGQFAGTWGPLGWSNIVSYLIFVVGYGYFLFVKPE